jgi:hypothetical protein
MIYLFGLLFLVITLIPSALAYLICRWLTKKGYKKIGLVVLLSVVFLTIYSSYTTFYPTDSFYEDEFEYNTTLNVPKSIDIIAKDASYPDTHGDYSAIAIFRTNEQEFNEILNAIQKDIKFQRDTIPFKYSKTTESLNKTYSEKSFSENFVLNRTDRDLIFNISFNSQDKLICIERNSW